MMREASRETAQSTASTLFAFFTFFVRWGRVLGPLSGLVFAP